MNICNSYSLYHLFSRGVKRATLSLDSTFDNTKKLIKEFIKKYNINPNLEVLVYGKVDNMISKYCPITKTFGVNKENCNLCYKNQYSLINQSNQEFELIRDSKCNIRVLSNKAIDKIKEIENYRRIGDIKIKS